MDMNFKEEYWKPPQSSRLKRICIELLHIETGPHFIYVSQTIGSRLYHTKKIIQSNFEKWNLWYAGSHTIIPDPEQEE